MLHAQGRTPRRRRVAPSAPTKRYDTHDFVDVTRELGVTPHVTQNLDAARRQRDRCPHDATRRATRRVSTRGRAIEPAFGWLKTIAWLRKVKLRGLAKVDWLFVFASAAFNLIRLPKLLPRPA